MSGYGNSFDARSTHAALLEDWQEQLAMPRLSHYGVSESDIPRIIRNISGGSMGGNPIILQNSELESLIHSRL